MENYWPNKYLSTIQVGLGKENIYTVGPYLASIGYVVRTSFSENYSKISEDNKNYFKVNCSDRILRTIFKFRILILKVKIWVITICHFRVSVL